MHSYNAKKAQMKIAKEKNIKRESEIIHKCVESLEETKKMDPSVEMTPASVSLFKSGKGQ